MSKKQKLSPLLSLLIIALAIGAWALENTGEPESKPQKVASSDNYQSYSGCTLAPHRSNDGDSFLVKLPDGRTEIFRLFFVDTPESEFRSYGGGENNHRRIQQQATDMGGISQQQAVEIGKKAKAYTLGLLQKSSFTVHTKWISPFKDRRYSAFVEIHAAQKSRFLHELLVEQGYARIFTKGAELPDGTDEAAHKKELFILQGQAQAKEQGVWGL